MKAKFSRSTRRYSGPARYGPAPVRTLPDRFRYGDHEFCVLARRGMTVLLSRHRANGRGLMKYCVASVVTCPPFLDPRQHPVPASELPDAATLAGRGWVLDRAQAEARFDALAPQLTNCTP